MVAAGDAHDLQLINASLSNKFCCICAEGQLCIDIIDLQLQHAWLELCNVQASINRHVGLQGKHGLNSLPQGQIRLSMISECHFKNYVEKRHMNCHTCASVQDVCGLAHSNCAPL